MPRDCTASSRPWDVQSPPCSGLPHKHLYPSGMNARRNPSGRKPGRAGSTRVRGRGDYASDAKANPSQSLARIETKLDKLSHKPVDGLGSGLGRLAGNFLGQGDLGAVAGDKLSKWLGFGDYELHSNSLIKGAPDSKSSSIPTFQKDGKRGIRVTEREYLGDVVSSSTIGAFNNTPYRINPADPASFPWLSQIAQQFEEWEPLGIIFEFVSTSSEFNGSSQALGTVIMATDYDPTDPQYPNKMVMESSDYCNSAKSSASQRHGVECDPAERPTKTLYCAAASPSADQRLCDLGTFQLATFGCSTASVTLGELWVTYDVAFYKKQLVGGQLALNLPTVVLASSSAFPPSTTYPLGTAPTYFGRDRLPMTIFSNGAGLITLAFPPSLSTGTYLVSYWATAGTNVSFSASPVVAAANTSIVPLYVGSTISQVCSNPAALVQARAVISINGPNAKFVIQNTTFTGTTPTADLIITQVAYAVPSYSAD
nr:MAG: putative capsid protein [Narnaviridae sp.]